MLHLLGLITVLAVARPPRDGEAAVTNARQLLHKLGIAGELQLLLLEI